MAKKKRTKKKRRSIGPTRAVPKIVAVYAGRALGSIRFAKARLEKLKPKARKAWAELHNCESRLSRLV